MKNLIVHCHYSRPLDNLKDSISQQTELLCAVTSITDDVYFILKNKLYMIPFDYESEIISINIDGEIKGKFVALEYSSLTEQLYCASESVEVIGIDVSSKLNAQSEILALINESLHCMKLSPDHEIIVLVTTSGTVITTLSDFQVISEVDLYSSDFGQKQFITVGWGKKETQFHGSAGKAAAKAKTEIIEGNESDDRLPRISWRGDGTLFAVNFLHPQHKTRQFKVFSREGILQYTSELLSGLEEPLSWKPSGSLIATTQRLPNKHVVAFFEKNGLKHREFTLPFDAKEVVVKELLWSPDSDVLTVWCYDLKREKSILQLWIENNYHWYMKQSITFTKEDPLLFASWSCAEQTGKKLILQTRNDLLIYKFSPTVSHSRGRTRKDKAVVGVIDGHKVLLTSFRNGIVPPPMAHQTIQFDDPINSIVFAPPCESEESWINSNTFFCISNDNKLTFFKEKDDTNGVEYEAIQSYEIEWDVPKLTCEKSYFMHHYLWFKQDTVVCSATVSHQSIFCVIQLENISSDEQGRVAVKSTFMMDGIIEHIIPSDYAEAVYIVVKGSVFIFKDNAEPSPIDVQLQEQSYKVDVIRVDTRDIIISLSHRHCLAFNGKEVANNITSFYVHTKFLLLTTLQHTLICVPLDEEGMKQLTKQDLTVKPWENNSNEKFLLGLSIRRVERGSSLVTAIPYDSKTILQMPRGNLECIQPRALSIHIIKDHLDDLNYLAAFDLMRKQRINLNLIYDHDPKLFINNAEKFISSIDNPSWLSLFLSELQEEDVTSTTYATSYTERKRPSGAELEKSNKVEHICETLRNAMEKRPDADRFIQPILISLVKNQQIKGLEAALRKIREVKALESSQNSTLCISSEEALKYLLYLIDVNVLFDIALGMYDSDLAMFVASKSQKDPKEYIPFLNDLKKLNENCSNGYYIKYTIDMHLKRYENALTNIAKENDRFKECTDLIQKHKLYVRALKLFEKEKKKYKEIAILYAKHLLSEMKYQEAGIMFQKGEDFEQAINAYKLAGSWQDAIIVSANLDWSPIQLFVLYIDLVKRLKENKRYMEASNILINYLKDFEEGVANLCKGKHWKDALRIVHKGNRLDLIETHVIPGVIEHASDILSELNSSKEEFIKRKSRLAEVRSEITARNLQFSNEMGCDNELIPNRGAADFLSDTTSIAGSTVSQRSRTSVSSSKSYRSSKNTRKQERKLLSMKEGSAFEDLGIIYTLHKIITNTYNLREELGTVLEMLVHFNYGQRAEELQDNMSDFLKIIESSKSEIWNKSAPSSFSEMELFTLNTDKSVSSESVAQKKFSSLGVEPHILYPPKVEAVKWRLEIFK